MPKKITTDIFIERAIAIYGTKYNYDKTVYIDAKTTVIISCNIEDHGEFYIYPSAHLSKKKRGCQKCGIALRNQGRDNNGPRINRRSNTEQFIQKSKAIHGDKYEYLKTNYILCNSPVIITCKIKEHGDFNQTPDTHIQGGGCQKCADNVILTNGEFITKAIKIHGKLYDYSKVEYVNSYTDVTIICNVVNHGEFCQNPSNHTKKPKGQKCPKCVNSCVHDEYNLEFLHPELICEWSHRNIKPMNEYFPGTHDKVWWVCSKNPCGCHEWEGAIIGRTSKYKTGCPYCSSYKLCDHNNLESLYPNLKPEWDPINRIPMREYTPCANKKVLWVCSKPQCEYQWAALISNRTKAKKPRGCPQCAAKLNGYSSAAIKWLEYIDMNEDITIRHALSKGGEYFIFGVGKVDGYCEETNTVYEYHGDYWHGNPEVFNPGDVNKTVNKTYGELYEKTMNRDQSIRNLGYNLIIKWESDDI